MATIWVNTDNISGTEDGTTKATGYTSLADWYANAGTTLGEDTTVECVGATEDVLSSTLQISKFTDVGTYTLTIRGEPTDSAGRYKGAAAWSTSHYRCTSTINGAMIDLRVGSSTVDQGVLFQDLQIESSYATASREAVIMNAGGDLARFHRCRFYTSDRGDMLETVASNDSSVQDVIGCCFFNAGNGTSQFVDFATRSGGPAVTRTYAHNTIYANGTAVEGFELSGGKSGTTVDVRNNVCFGADPSSDVWFDITDTTSTLNATHNAGPGASAPTNHDSNWVQLTGTASDTDFVDALNTDETDVDWEPASGGAIDGAGTAGYSLSEDLAGNAWDSPPSIGAWAIPSAGGASISPPAATLAYTCTVPSVAAGASVTVPAATLAYTGTVPVVGGGDSVTAPAASVAYTLQVPAVAGGDSVQPPAATLSYTCTVPSVAAGVNIEPPAATLAYTCAVPAVTASAGGTDVQPPAAVLAYTCTVPAVSTGASVTAPAATLSYTCTAPAVSAGVNIEAPAATLAYTCQVPTVTAAESVNIAPPAATLTYTCAAPTVSTGVNIETPAGTVSYQLYAPEVDNLQAPADTTPTGGGSGAKKVRERKYPRRVIINGEVYVVRSAQEERLLLERLRREAQRAVEVAEEDGTPREVETKRRIVRRIARREQRLEDALPVVPMDAWLERLRDEDEQIILLLAS